MAASPASPRSAPAVVTLQKCASSNGLPPLLLRKKQLLLLNKKFNLLSETASRIGEVPFFVWGDGYVLRKKVTR